jgi:hypothetical protein
VQRPLTSGRETLVPHGWGGRILLAACICLVAVLLALVASGTVGGPASGNAGSGAGSDQGDSPSSAPPGIAPAPATARRSRSRLLSRFHADLESGDFSQFDQAASVNASLDVTKAEPFRGFWSAEATYSGAGANGYARGIFHPTWRAGDKVRYGAAFRLPDGFYGLQSGQVDLVRWDNWPLHQRRADFGGIVIYGSDQRARLVRGRYNGEEVPLGSSFQLPEGRWFTVSVFQRLSRRHPLSKVRLDGSLVSSSRAKNFYGRPIDRIRCGIVAIDSGHQFNSLRLWFDEANAKSWR